MKNVLVIGSKNVGAKNNPSLIAEGLNRAEVVAEVLYWEDLLFKVIGGKVHVTYEGVDIADKKPDLVIAVGWYKNGDKSIYRDLAFSLALYLEYNGIEFWNREMIKQRSVTKLSCAVQLALSDVSVPDVYFSLDKAQILGCLQMPFVAKAAAASRGMSNYLIKSSDDLKEVIKSKAYFIVQPYLPNDHDLRVICFGGNPALVLKRSRAKNALTHLNNISQGANAEWLELTEVRPEILTTSQKICKVLDREMGGIDLIPDNSSDIGYSCLEVNAIPQLTSGTDSDKKLMALANSLLNQ